MRYLRARKWSWSHESLHYPKHLQLCAFPQGAPSDPGIVQRAIRDVFRAIEETPDRDFLLRLSMMEIYNEVSNHSIEGWLHFPAIL